MMLKTVAFATLVLTSAASAGAQDAPDFKGKTVTFLIGDEANGGFDVYGRLFARFLGAHLPGNPTVIVKNMPGAGGLLAANAIYNVSPHDGTEIGLIG